MPCYELIKPLLKFNGDPGPFNLNYHCTVLIAMEVCNHLLSCTFLLGCQQKHKIWFMMIVTSIQKLHYKNLIKGSLRSSPIWVVMWLWLVLFIVGFAGKSFVHNSFYSSQRLAFLSSCKIEQQLVTDMKNMRLVNINDRSWVWKVNSETAEIFTIPESSFLSFSWSRNLSLQNMILFI